MTKLDWTKGYTVDPARVRSVEDFSTPDPLVPKGSKPKHPDTWSSAMKARRVAEQNAKAKKPSPIDSRTLLAALGVSKRALKSKNRGIYLRRFVREGILLPTGLPNLDHPKVKEVILLRLGRNVK